MQDLGTLGGTNSDGWAINAHGQVVGSSDISGDSAEHAFLYDDTSMLDLGTLGGTYSQAMGINSSGIVVGESYSTATSTSSDAFLYDGSNMLNLCTLVGCIAAGWDFLEAATGISDSGHIIGDGLINGESHAC